MLVISVTGMGAGCGDGDPAEDTVTDVMVTTTILGDVVDNIASGDVRVEVVMPAGADPHEFEPSARQAEAMTEADLLVVNGAGFEPGLAAAIEAARDAGVTIFTATDHVELLRTDGAPDPHFWTDPSRMVDVVEALGATLADATGARAYGESLRALDAEIESIVAPVPRDRRILVTNHEVLGYFADRYGFEVVGTVIPSTTTGAAPSAADLDRLADVLVDTGARALFAETTASTAIAEALAETVGDVDVVELHTESLGRPGSGADSYLGMQRTNARLIVEALSP